MNDYLIEIAFGPVQGFIASARRTADLWGGSQILSDIARVAAKSLCENGAELIYPIPQRVQNKNTDESNLSNVLLAQIKDCDIARVKDVAEKAMLAGKGALLKCSTEALQEWSKVNGLREDIWVAQIDDAVESFAAWTEIGSEGYGHAYGKLKSAFAARKNTRDFVQAFRAADGIPKSSLDGLRESVLPENQKRKRLPARFRMTDGEQLDALGCIKRYKGGSEKFTALTRLAADPWLRQLAPADCKKLAKAYEPLIEQGYATRATGNDGIYSDFAFDAALLYQDRLAKTISDAVKVGADMGALEHLRGILRELWRNTGHPSPYAALLMADGDRMGKFVSSARNKDAHSSISGALASFADEAIQVLRRNRGHTIYAGGEDILALLPLPGVITASRELAETFDMKITGIKNVGVSSDKPTLRVGVAICHVLEPLGRIRQYAEAAEKYAKGDAGTRQQGNALGLRLHVRAGHDVPCRISFGDHDKFNLFAGWIEAYEKGYFPSRLAYDTRAIGEHCQLRRYSPEVARAEFRLLLDRARKHARVKNDDAWSKLKSLSSNGETSPESLIELGNELVLARWMAARTLADLGERS